MILEQSQKFEELVTFKRNFSETIKSLENSKFNFYLTGSFKLGNNRYSSDVDFFVEYNEEVDEFLKLLKFVKYISHSSYLDILTKEVYRSQVTLPNIDIQVVYNAEVKLMAQNKLNNYLYTNTDPGEFITIYWNKFVGEAAKELGVPLNFNSF